ncbi:HTH-type transcriptional regulator DmlR [compost metagenome]
MAEDLNDISAFLTVARERNFTRAAAQLGISQSALSRTVRALETRMNTPLLVRSTRSVSLTEAGERLVSTVGPRLSEIQEELDSLRSLTLGPSGTVRITATDSDANTYVWPRVMPLLRMYPELKIEIVNDYGFRDIVADRCDIGVRLGSNVAQDMVAARIAPDLTMAIVGSPEYLKNRPSIETPQDLTTENCICLRLPTHNSLLQWELKNGKKQLQVKVDGQLIFNNVYQILEAAISGFGLAYLPKDLVEPHVKTGKLQWVLPDWHPNYTGQHIYYPSRRKPSRAVELVVAALKTGYSDG